MYCQNCGAQLRDGARFCWSCGRAVEGAPPPPPRTPGAPEDAGDSGTGASGNADLGAEGRPEPRVCPAFLHVAQYQHPEDRRATEAIKVLSPVVAVTRLIIAHMGEPSVTGQLLGNAVKAGPKQFPRLYGIAEECARILHVPVPDIYVRQNPTYNAMTFGVDKPFILLYSALVDGFSDDELRYILGHEMGHIKSQHSLYLTTFHLLTTQAARLVARYGLGMLVFRAARLALESWSRSAELSADRAGLICSQDVDTAARALVKLVLGSRRLASEVDVDVFLRQSEAGSAYNTVSELGESHPLVARRIRELRDFDQSTEYAAILDSGADPKTASPELIEALAAEILDQAVRQIKPGALTNLFSAITRDRGGLEKGAADLHRLLDLYPKTEAAAAAEFYLAFCAMHLRRAAEAVTRFERFLEEHPDHEMVPEARFDLGSSYLWLLKDSEAARKQFERLVEEHPKSLHGKEAREILADWPDRV